MFDLTFNRADLNVVNLALHHLQGHADLMLQMINAEVVRQTQETNKVTEETKASEPKGSRGEAFKAAREAMVKSHLAKEAANGLAAEINKATGMESPPQGADDKPDHEPGPQQQGAEPE